MESAAEEGNITDASVLAQASSLHHIYCCLSRRHSLCFVMVVACLALVETPLLIISGNLHDREVEKRTKMFDFRFHSGCVSSSR